MRHNDGNWAGYTYEWNAGGTDATRVVGGKTVQVAGQTWEFPSEAQCLQCHTAAAGRSLGLEIGQLNGDFGYPHGPHRQPAHHANAIDTLTPALTQTPAQLPVIPDPFGSAAAGRSAPAPIYTRTARIAIARAGPRPPDIDFRYTTALVGDQYLRHHADARRTSASPMRGIIAPGSAARSVAVARVNRIGADAMPPLSRHVIDTAGVQLLTTGSTARELQLS